MPEDVCARGMFEAIKDFSTDDSIARVLKEIHVVVPNPEMFQVVFRQLLAMTAAGHEPDVRSAIDLQSKRMPSGGRKATVGGKSQQKVKKVYSVDSEDAEDNEGALPSAEPGGFRHGSKAKMAGSSQTRCSSSRLGSTSSGRDTSASKKTRPSTASRITSSVAKVPAAQTTLEAKRKSQTALQDAKKRISPRASRECRSLDRALLDKKAKAKRGSLHRDRDAVDGAEGIREKDKANCCPICQDVIKDAKKLSKCGHVFCTECIDECFETHGQKKCPVCGIVYGMLRGDQPRDGTMTCKMNRSCQLPGYEGVPTIEITYSFPAGKQEVCKQLGEV